MAAVNLEKSITIAISVADRYASADWYESMLGFELLYHADDAGWSELKTSIDGVTLGLDESSEATPGSTIPVFGVSDLAAARAALERAGVRFDGDTVVIEGMVSTATLFDPDANVLMLAEDHTIAQSGDN